MPSSSGSSGGASNDPGRAAVLSLRERLSQTFLKAPKPAAEAKTVRDRPMTNDEKRLWIRGLEPVERKWGMILAAYGAIVALYLTVPDLTGKHYVHEKITPKHGHPYWAWVSTGRSSALLLGLLLAISAGAFLAAYFRKRAILGFCLLIGAFASNVLGIPMLIMAGWIFIRSWRVQKYGSTDAKVAAKAASERREAKKRGEKVGGLFSRAPAGSSSSTTVDATSTMASGPRRASEASKRYTPPKPKKDDSKRRAGSTAKKTSAKSTTKS